MSTPAPAAKRTRRSRGRRLGLGSVRKLPSGRWQARYTDTQGVRHSAPRTFDTARAAEDWIATSRADLIRGQWHSPSLGAIGLAEYAADHLAARVDLSMRTRVLYQTLLDQWILPELRHPAGRRTVALGRMHLRDITTGLVRDWHAAAMLQAQERAAHRAQVADDRRKARARHAAREWAWANGWDCSRTGRIPATVLEAWAASGAPASATLAMPPTRPAPDAGRVPIAQAYRLLRSILATAVDDGLIPANPCTIKAAGHTKARERVPATPAEVAKLAALVPSRFGAAVLVAAYSGLRAGELFGLTRAHVDTTRGTVRVERALIDIRGHALHFGPPKTTSSLRMVHLPAPVNAALAKHLATFTAPGPDALVFANPDGSPVDERQRTRMWREACAEVGLHDLRWHDLRHTGATLAAQAGASLRELQARLGHSTINAAMIYQHATAERDREVADRMAGLVIVPEHDGAAVLPLRSVN